MTRIFRTLAEVPADYGPSVVTVGNFDGVHCGHKAVLQHVTDRAHILAAKSVAITFTPHPMEVVRPEAAPKLITPDDVKLELLAQTGLDAVLVLNFDEVLRTTSARDFAETILHNALHAVEVHEGDNFQFGYRGEGSVAGLQQLGAELGFTAVVSPPMMFAHEVISSSRVRACIAAGQLAEARHLTGRSFTVRSKPAAGRGYGSRYVVSTINLAPYAGLLPPHGVYVSQMRIGDDSFQAVTNIGVRPTFGADSFAVESHLLDFHTMHLDETTQLDLTFHMRLRDERKFASPEELKAQILRDVARAHRWFRLRAVI